MKKIVITVHFHQPAGGLRTMTRMLRMTRALTKLWFESKWACQKKEGASDAIVSPIVVFPPYVSYVCPGKPGSVILRDTFLMEIHHVQRIFHFDIIQYGSLKISFSVLRLFSSNL